MRTSSLLMALVALLTVFAGACDDDSGGGTGSGPVPIEDLPEVFADAYCDAMLDCVGRDMFDLFLQGMDCETFAQRNFEDGAYASLVDAIERGTATYDPDKMRACANAYASAGCDLLMSATPAACQEAMEGTVALDGACDSRAECADAGWYCQIENNTCPGVCALRRDAGEECSYDEECTEALVCSGATRRCVVPPDEGEACQGGVEPNCRPGLLCVGAEIGTPGECREPGALFSGAEGEACVYEGGPWCQHGLGCATTAIDGIELTRECLAPVAVDAPCYFAVPELCPVGYYCDVELFGGDLEGTCEPLPEPGEACAPLAFRPQRCAAYSVCVLDTCREKQRLGEPCESDAMCYSETCEGGGCAQPNPCM